MLMLECTLYKNGFYNQKRGLRSKAQQKQVIGCLKIKNKSKQMNYFNLKTRIFKTSNILKTLKLTVQWRIDKNIPCIR